MYKRLSLPAFANYRAQLMVRWFTFLLLPIFVAQGDETTQKTTHLISDQAQVSLITNVTLTSSVAGEVAALEIVEGQKVEVGQRLVQLDDELARAELVACERAFEAVELQATTDIDARFATRSLEVRLRELEQNEAANQQYRGTVSSIEMERLRLVVDQARLSVEQAEHERKVADATAGEKRAAVEAALIRLKRHAVVSPCNGSVAETMVQVGQRIEVGDPISRIIDLASLRIECLVEAEQVAGLAAGAAVTFRQENGREYGGTVTFISSEVHPVTRQIRFWATVQNEDGALRPGTRGRLEAIVTADEEASTPPASSNNESIPPVNP